MNMDYTYCSGVSCKIRSLCKRYLPDPPNARLYWTNPAYKENVNQCENFVKR